MDLPYAFVDSIAKMVPTELNITLDKALKMNPEFKKLYQEDEQVKELIDMSRRLEGLPRHTSMHAAGVVIGQRAIEEFVPLSLGSDGSVTTQFTMTTLEELGLLKMDFLGLRTLTVIQDAERLASISSGKTIDINKIDYDDKAVLASIGTGKTDGVFQLESAGMKNFMKELNRLMDVSYIRNRLCRSCVIWLDIRLDEAIFCEERCRRKRAMSCRKSARISYTVIRTKACRAISPTESTRRRRIRFMMK